MLPFGEAWTGSLIYRRSDTLPRRGPRGRPPDQVDDVTAYVRPTLMTWGSTQGIALTSIQTGNRQRNAHVNLHNRPVPHEWLDLVIFETI